MNQDRIKLFEIFAVIATAILKFVFVDWLNLRTIYIVIICLFWSVYIYSKFKGNPESVHQWGFQKRNFKKPLLFLLPFVILCIACFVGYGYFSGAHLLNWHILPILFLYPLWGLIQQFIVAGLISGNLKALRNPRVNNFQIILFSALLFSLVHFPNPFLMIFTFIMQLIFTTAFLRWENIWPLGIYHGWIATFLLFYVLGRDLWVELMAGFQMKTG